MAEYNNNLWAPWRMEYIRSLSEEQQVVGCFLCDYWAHPEQDAAHHVLWRGRSAFVLMNRFPYTNGHLLIAHGGHKGHFADLTGEELAELMGMLRDASRLVEKACDADGMNIGFNLGRCAGAGLPDHLHGHVVPRWNGDTNFMAILGDTRVIPDSLDAMYAQFLSEVKAMGYGTR
ncbi:MAG: HIT domain-containing protein [Vicinamibacterales bacterium]